jgi:hypothetical protein
VNWIIISSSYHEVKPICDVFFDLALDRGESSASRPGRFTPRERGPATSRIGG